MTTTLPAPRFSDHANPRDEGLARKGFRPRVRRLPMRAWCRPTGRRHETFIHAAPLLDGRRNPTANWRPLIPRPGPRLTPDRAARPRNWQPPLGCGRFSPWAHWARSSGPGQGHGSPAVGRPAKRPPSARCRRSGRRHLRTPGPAGAPIASWPTCTSAMAVIPFRRSAKLG